MPIHLIKPGQLSDLYPVFDRIEAKGGAYLIQPPEARGFRLESGLSPEWESGAHIGLFTSGSTGWAKLIWRRWDHLKSEVVRRNNFHRWSWGSAFAPHTFAGVQVAMHAWANGGRAVSLPNNPVRSSQMMREEKLNALCCTPTFLDMLLLACPPKAGLALEQLTLGGEPIPPRLAPAIRRALPEARVTAIYATAELGILLKTHRCDGWYELGELRRRVPEWRAENSVLQVKRGGAWQTTGDLVEISGGFSAGEGRGLIRVIGRADRTANVAGTKVSLDQVASLAEMAPGVRRARADAEPNRITGQVVVLRVCAERSADFEQVKKTVEPFLRSILPKPAWPRKWVLDPLLPGPNSKRRASAGAAWIGRKDFASEPAFAPGLV